MDVSPRDSRGMGARSACEQKEKNVVKMEKLSIKQINEFIRDERMAVKEYSQLGLPGLARDEERHLNFFKMLRARR